MHSIERRLRELETQLKERHERTVSQLEPAREDYRKVATLSDFARISEINGRAQGQYDALEMLRACIAQCASLGLFDQDN